MHNSSRRDKGQLKAKKLKTVFIQHTVNKIALSFHLQGGVPVHCSKELSVTCNE